MSFVPNTLVRVKLDPLNPGNSFPVMKRIDEVKIHYDWALTHNLNWGLILTDHYGIYSGPLVRIKYAGAMLPLICHPDQRFCCPGKRGYAWRPVGDLRQGDQVFFVRAHVMRDDAIMPVSITEYDVVKGERVKMYTLTVADELSFIAHDLIAHRNHWGYTPEAHTKYADMLVGGGIKSSRLF